MELLAVLTWLVSGGGAGVLAYVLVEKVAFLAKLPSESKRYAAIGLSATLAMGAFGIQVGVGYQPAPETALAWIESLFLVGTSAFTLSQIIHGKRKLCKK